MPMLEIDEPDVIRNCDGGIEGLGSNYKDVGWYFVGECAPHIRALAIHHQCRDQRVCWKPAAEGPITSAQFSKLCLEVRMFGEPFFKHGRAWKFTTILIAQCPRCQNIYWSRHLTP